MANSFKIFCAKKVEEWSKKVNDLLPGKEEYDKVYDELSAYGSWQSTDLGIDKLEPDNDAYKDAERICNKWESVLNQMNANEYPSSLNLAELGLEFFPVEICDLKNLESIDLSGNQIACLPKEISGLTHLSALDVSNNKISELPAEIGRLKNLKSLDLSNNPLGKLPPEIEQLINLKTIKV